MSALFTPEHPHWPSRLADLSEEAPTQLWSAGDTSVLLSPMVAVVGSRANTPYGQRVAADIVSGLPKKYTVVSGGAFGIDTVAHRMVLAEGRKTVAVLPSGLHKLHPVANTELLHRIAEVGGLLVSEYEPDAVPSRSSFLHRNRIVAALAVGVVVIEAGRRSGTLITAGRATKLNRPLMVVPGPVTSACSTGCHQLLKDGAHLVTDAEDVLTVLAGQG